MLRPIEAGHASVLGPEWFIEANKNLVALKDSLPEDGHAFFFVLAPIEGSDQGVTLALFKGSDIGMATCLEHACRFCEKRGWLYLPATAGMAIVGRAKFWKRLSAAFRVVTGRTG